MTGVWHERHGTLEAYENQTLFVVALNAGLFLISNAGAFIRWNHEGLA